MSNQITARSDAISYQELLEDETVPVPAHLRFENAPEAGTQDIPVSYYTSREQHEQEAAKVWPRVWQLVCREEDIPEVGDHYVYDIVDDSVIVTRTAEDRIQGFINSCLHRGRALRTENGRVSEFQCPFHGFTWNLDGSFKKMPCAWDFEHLDKSKLTLPQVRVDRWAGFVFICFDDNAPELLDFLGVLPEHFERYNVGNTFKAIHVQRMIPCNWKIAHEAFLESWHSVTTHPQILTFIADENTQYDVLDEHITRMITASNKPSPHLEDTPPEQQILKDTLENSGRMSAASAEGIELPQGQSAREFVGEMNRKAYAEASGEDLSEATLSELQDAILYDVFPNIQIWAGYNGNIVYQFRPDGDDHTRCIFDVRILVKAPPGQPKPEGVPIKRLTDDQPFGDAEELGALGEVFDQDMGNLPYMMKGLKASKKGAVSLANYQEQRVRHLYQTIEKYINF